MSSEPMHRKYVSFEQGTFALSPLLSSHVDVMSTHLPASYISYLASGELPFN